MKMIQDIIVAPIVTENSMEAMQHKKYTFKVMKTANKVEIAKAVEAMFPGTKVCRKHHELRRQAEENGPLSGLYRQLQEGDRDPDRGFQDHRVL